MSVRLRNNVIASVGVRWGGISGSLASQTDLRDALNGKASAESLDGLNAKIPPSATAQNQLVTAAQMGDAISSVEARQLYATSAQGSFATKASLTSATTFYLANGDATTPTKNDVAYVLADESHDGKAAKYVLASETGAALVWGFVITFGTTFTQEQLDALQSGITAAKVATYDGYATGKADLVDGKVPQRQLPAGAGVVELTGNAVTVEVGKAYSWAPGTTAATLNLAEGTDTSIAWTIPIRLKASNVTSSLISINKGLLHQYSYNDYVIVCNGTTVSLALLSTHAANHSASATGTGAGPVKAISTYGMSVNDAGYLLIAKPSNDNINNRGSYHAVRCDTIDYAVRSVSPLITTLPSDAASPIALTDASATTRNHSYTYIHTPDTAPTYQLPAVTNSTTERYICLEVDFLNASSVLFTDATGNIIPLQHMIDIAAGDKYRFVCWYSGMCWLIYPIMIVPVILSAPILISSVAGQPIPDTVVTATATNGASVSFSASDMPDGVVFDSNTISGAIGTAGTYTAVVKAHALGAADADITVTFTVA